MDDVIILGSKEEIFASVEPLREFCLAEKLILRKEKIKIHPIRDGVKFCGYDIIDGKLFAGKRIRLGFQHFMDRLDALSEKEKLSPTLTKSDRNRLRSVYASRKGCFALTSGGSSYIESRGSAEFIRGGNANNGTNDGVFTLNLN